jgi:hypothetical protein
MMQYIGKAKIPASGIRAIAGRVSDFVDSLNQNRKTKVAGAVPMPTGNMDYDVDAWRKADPQADAKIAKGEHGPDTYKLPSHITFSDESIYHGKNGAEGGHWSGEHEDSWTFTPGKTNLENYTPKEMRDYFKKYEPDNKLNLPQEK